MVKIPPANAGDAGSIPGLGRSPEAGNGNPLVLLPGKFHGQRHLVDYSPGIHKESDMTVYKVHTTMIKKLKIFPLFLVFRKVTGSVFLILLVEGIYENI